MTHQNQHDVVQHDVAQHDQAIEDVLHALHNPAPPQGYEARIHNALLQASAEPRSNVSRIHRASLATARLINRHPERSVAKTKDLLGSLLPWMSWATACAALLIAGITVRTHLHHEEPHATPSIAHATSPSPTPAIVATKTPVPTIKPSTRHEINTQQAEPTKPRRIEVELQAHEYIPEPPMPLTEQERLVIRMMRRNTAQQLAEYTPDARARQLYEDAKAYNDYFAATSLDGQPIYVQPIDHPQLSGGN